MVHFIFSRARRVKFFVCNVFLKFARVGTIVKPVFMELSKKHVRLGAVVESTTGGSEKETPLPLQVGYVARLPVMESKSCPIKKRKKRNTHYVLRSNRQVALEDAPSTLCPPRKADEFPASGCHFPIFTRVDQMSVDRSQDMSN
ncbi:hypothetical protein X777_14349 [Ooceraea biroi]|uniref:Uncharacterized protein n=1 Tax=Ooceraea biroi TaxID=2015173 RepID=A0A026WUT6_OOCBI|nr:hypothetical protein X777_14349 [Ooceraea biroi]